MLLGNAQSWGVPGGMSYKRETYAVYIQAGQFFAAYLSGSRVSQYGPGSRPERFHGGG
jgi:hypothetical protein